MKFCVVPDSSERCTGLIGRVRQLDAGVVGGDRGVVPLGDLAGEDAGRRLRRQLQRPRRRAGCRRWRSARCSAAGRWRPRRRTLLRLGEVLVVERGVRAGEVGAAGEEGRASAAASRPGRTGSWRRGCVSWKPTVHACMAAACDVAPEPTSVPLTGSTGAVVPSQPALGVACWCRGLSVPPSASWRRSARRCAAAPCGAAAAVVGRGAELSSSSPHAARTRVPTTAAASARRRMEEMFTLEDSVRCARCTPRGVGASAPSGQ